MISHKFDFEFEENDISLLKKSISIDPSFLDLTISNPTKCGFNYSIFQNLPGILSEKNLIYSPEPKGLPKARIAVSEYYSNRLNFNPESIFFTSGTSESYSILFKLLTNPGDNILLPSPSYPLLEHLAMLENIEYSFFSFNIRNSSFELETNAFEYLIKKNTKAIIIVNPNNPTGNYLSENEFNILCSICSENSISLIIDEVFFDYSFQKFELPYYENILRNYENINVFFLNGFSKLAALPQLKLAWIAVKNFQGESNITNNALEFICDTYLSVNTPVQNAVPEILKRHHLIKDSICNRIAHNYSLLRESNDFFYVLNSMGGWNAVIESEFISFDENFILEFLEDQKCFIHPGYFYNFPDDSFAVLSLIIPEEQFSEGIQRLNNFITVHK